MYHSKLALSIELCMYMESTHVQVNCKRKINTGLQEIHVCLVEDPIVYLASDPRTSATKMI